MSVVTDSNYTQPSAATYHNLDSDQYSRALSYTNTLIDLLAHDHRTTHGLAAGRLTTNAIAATANTGECQVVTGGLKVTDGTSVNNLTDVTNNGATAYKALGLTGATAASRYVGATSTGAPTSGTFAVGDFVIDQQGHLWVCRGAGTPGTWLGLTQGLIQDQILGAPAATIVFAGIPAIGRHLRLVVSGRCDGATATDPLLLQFNGDTGANYVGDYGNYTSANAPTSNPNNTTHAVVGLLSGASDATGSAGNGIIDIPDYASTTFWKTLSAAGGVGNQENGIAATMTWKNTAAITSITLFPTVSTNFIAGTRATLSVS